MDRRNIRDILGGLLVGIFGVLFLIGGRNLRFGTAEHMGPGYLPTISAGILILLGAGVLWRGMKTSGSIEEQIRWRALISIAASFISFGLGLQWLGLIPAVFLAFVIASFADRESHFFSTIVGALVVAVGAWAVFSLGLGLPMPGIRGMPQWGL